MATNIYEKATRITVLENSFIDELVCYVNSNNRGVLNMVTTVLTTIKDRIKRGDKIVLEETGLALSMEAFEKLVSEKFTVYITKAVFKNRPLKSKVYFKVEKTDKGLDLVYTYHNQNKLYRWIADIDDEYALMELIPTGVVYIRNSNTRQMIPFISKHGNYFTYKLEEGIISEIK